MLASGSHGPALRALDAALALWHGEAFGGIPGPYAQRRRASLEELRLATQEQRAEAMLGLGAAADVVGQLTELVRTYPLRESLRALLMTALHRTGRRDEALTVYQDAATLLMDELGIEPSPPLTKLFQQLQAGEVRPVISARASHHARVPDGFVSRAREVARMQAMVAEVVAGRGGVLDRGRARHRQVRAARGRLAVPERAGCSGLGRRGRAGHRFPLRAMLDCLDVDAQSPDPRRAELARRRRRPGRGLWPGATR